MTDVRVSPSASFVLIELLTDRARTWYAENVPGAPAVSSNSLTIDAGATEDLLRRMVKAGLSVEKP